MASVGVTAPARVVVQGFGMVGRAVARILEAQGHLVVGVADARGTVIDPAGLPIAALENITDSSGLIQRNAVPEYIRQLNDDAAWLEPEADVLVLAANADAVNASNASHVNTRLVVEGGNLCCSAESVQLLAGREVLVVPDVVANVGAAAVGGCALTGSVPSDLSALQRKHWLFDWVEERVRRNTKDVVALAQSGNPAPVQTLIRYRAKDVA